MSSPKSINRLPSLGHEIASDWQSSLSSNGNIFLSPTRPSTDSESCTQTGQQSPKTRQHQSTTGGRFACRLIYMVAYELITMMYTTLQTST